MADGQPQQEKSLKDLMAEAYVLARKLAGDQQKLVELNGLIKQKEKNEQDTNKGNTPN